MARLPQKYIPSHYDLFLHVASQQTPESSFEAKVTIEFQKNDNDDKSYLNINSNIIIKSIIQNEIPLEYTINYPILIINRSSKQDISSYPITINYTLTPISTNFRGLYSYKNCFFTSLEPNYAQTLLPCFDDPSVKSTYSVKIQIPANLTGLSNMPYESTTMIDDAEKLIQFQKTPPMCSYLLAIFVGEFDHIEGQTKTGIPVLVYSEKGKQDSLKKVLDAATFSIDWLEEKTNSKYELPFLQLCSHPGIKTGMENYGLIALQDYTQNADSVDSILVVMHEVSHLWFGDLVSIKWWDSVFLNEGFAQYFMYLILNDFSEEYSNKAFQLFVKDNGIDSLNYFDMEKIVVEPSEINFNYHILRSVIYNKGAFVLKMFHDIVGDVNFYKVCSEWVREFKNKSADLAQFLNVVKNTLNHDYSEFFNNWLRKIGLPYLSVTEICGADDGKITGLKFTQTSFSRTIFQFKISLVYECDGEIKKTEILMTDSEKVVDLNCDWVWVNKGMDSLCAVLYSKVLLEKLCVPKKNGLFNRIDMLYIRVSANVISNYFDVDKSIFDIIRLNFRD